MFDKVEYSDLYKFLTSIGLILIGASFLLPWLFLRNEIGNAISQEQFEKIIESSQHLIESKNRLQLFVFSALPWVTPIMFIVGAIMTTYGIRNWSIKQKIIDESETLNLTKLRAEVKPLDYDEIRSKAHQEIEDELSAESDEPAGGPEKELTKQDKIDLSQKLINLESQIYERIIEYNTFDYKPEQNVKIAGRHEVDILLNAYNQTNHSDKLIEVKFLQNKLSMHLIRDAHKRLSQIRFQYVRSTNRRNTKVVLIVVFRSNIAGKEEIERFKKAFNEFKGEVNARTTELHLMTDEEVFKFDIKSLLN